MGTKKQKKSKKQGIVKKGERPLALFLIMSFWQSKTKVLYVRCVPYLKSWSSILLDRVQTP